MLMERLTEELAAWTARTRPELPCRVIDLGGGTGTFASQLADQGHALTVIDPNLDALASLERRATEWARGAGAGATGSIRGVQGDASELVELVGAGAADVVVCHRVLEVVDDPEQALTAVAAALRPRGALSLVVGLRRSVVLGQALAGHLGSALRTWQDRRRFDLEQVEELVVEAGFRIVSSEGVGAVAGYVPEALVESDAAAHEELATLERALSTDPAFRALAPAVHVFAELAG